MCAEDKLSVGQVCTAFGTNAKPGYGSNCTAGTCATGFTCQFKTGTKENPVCHTMAGGICTPDTSGSDLLCAGGS